MLARVALRVLLVALSLGLSLALVELALRGRQAGMRRSSRPVPRRRHSMGTASTRLPNIRNASARSRLSGDGKRKPPRPGMACFWRMAARWVRWMCFKKDGQVRPHDDALP